MIFSFCRREQKQQHRQTISKFFDNVSLGFALLSLSLSLLSYNQPFGIPLSLLQHFSASPNQNNSFQRTPLHLIIYAGAQEVAAALAERGADLSLVDCYRSRSYNWTLRLEIPLPKTNSWREKYSKTTNNGSK
jgi:ankyrin repeat protein